MCIFSFYRGEVVFAQEESLGLVEKYNRDFAGIGPQVYILPAPRTKEEVLIGLYLQKKKEQTELESLIERVGLQKQLMLLSDSALLSNVHEVISTTGLHPEKKILTALHYYQQNNMKAAVTDCQNNLAIYYLITGKIEESRVLFLTALKAKEAIGSISDQLAILNNLALLETKFGDSRKALFYYDKLLNQAKEVKNINHQALAYMAIARLESRQGNFSVAHNLMVEKSFPLLHKTKNYHEVVNALLDLASFKETANKPIEAKWIYLQAIDVATMHKDEEGLVRGLFKVAELKSRIGDAHLAIADYAQAKELAIKNNMDALLVEIIDGLGNAYMQLNDYSEAVAALNEYNTLKTDFLNQHAKM